MNKHLDRFELIEQIEVGGYTTVYRAVEHMGQGITRPAAVKVLQAWNLNDDEQLARLKREVELLVEIGSAPNIVSTLAMGVDAEMGPWIAMELVGKNLRYSMGEKPAEPNQVRALLRDVLRALQWVHGTDPPILHRDLKPQNILSTNQGFWKVADFGLAKRRGAEETMTLATVKYAAPELLDSTLGEESPRVDIYALGMLAYEMACGRELFRKQFPSIYDPMRGAKESEGDDRPKWMYWHTSMQMRLSPISDLIEDYPRDLSDLLEAMTQKSVSERIASADEALGRLGEVSIAVPVEKDEDQDAGKQRRGVSPVLAAVTTVVILAALVGTLMWYLLKGRPSIELVPGGRYVGNSSLIEVTGRVENPPEAGRAAIQLRHGTARSFPVALEPNGRFTCEVRVDALGAFPAVMHVSDRSGARVARASLEVVREIPAEVMIEVKTNPSVPDANIVLRPSGQDAEALQLATNMAGVASAAIPFGDFTLEVFHPRYQPLPRTTLQTGIDPVWSRTVSLVERDISQLVADMQREVDRLMRLMERKVTCPPGPLSQEEERQAVASVERLRQLAAGDADMELFIASVLGVEECDPSTMITAPPMPVDPRASGGLASADPDAAMKRLLDRIERLIDRKVTCPPGPLSEFEEQALESALQELEALALGDLDIQLYLDGVRRVSECDPSSRPDPFKLPESRESRGRAELARSGSTDPAGRSSRDRRAGGAGAASADALRADLTRHLQAGGDAGRSPRGAGGGRGGQGRSANADALIGEVLAGVPPNPALVQYLTEELSLDEFLEFVRSNVPTGALRVEKLEALDQVRLHGPVFDAPDLEWMVKRLAYGWSRLQPELRIDAWGVCRELARALRDDGASGVQVDAYSIPNDPTVFVQYKRVEGYDDAGAEALAKSFVVDQGLLWIRGYIELPAESLPSVPAGAPDE